MQDETNVGMPTFDVDSLGFSDTVDETITTETETKVEETKVEESVAQEKEIEQKQETVEETKTTEETKEIRISNPPTRHPNETDIQFNLRTQMYNAGQAKAQAETPEEKSELSKHISGLRKELAKASSQPKVETTQPQEANTGTPETSPDVSEEEQIKSQLKKLGFLTAEEYEAKTLEIVQKSTRGQEHESAIQQFYQSRKDIAVSPENKRALENLVIQKFNITENSSGADILVAMDMAASYLFPKNDNRSSNAQAAAEKRDLVNFSSNTKSDSKGIDKNDQKAKDTLKDLGWSDEDLKSFGF